MALWLRSRVPALPFARHRDQSLRKKSTWFYSATKEVKLPVGSCEKSVDDHGRRIYSRSTVGMSVARKQEKHQGCKHLKLSVPVAHATIRLRFSIRTGSRQIQWKFKFWWLNLNQRKNRKPQCDHSLSFLKANDCGQLKVEKDRILALSIFKMQIMMLAKQNMNCTIIVTTMYFSKWTEYEPFLECTFNNFESSKVTLRRANLFT